jgi:hypothetical protein
LLKQVSFEGYARIACYLTFHCRTVVFISNITPYVAESVCSASGLAVPRKNPPRRDEVSGAHGLSRLRFPRPWTVEETAPCFIVRDANKQALAFTGRRATAKLLTRDEARRIAANIAKLPELLRR